MGYSKKKSAKNLANSTLFVDARERFLKTEDYNYVIHLKIDDAIFLINSKFKNICEIEKNISYYNFLKIIVSNKKQLIKNYFGEENSIILNSQIKNFFKTLIKFRTFYLNNCFYTYSEKPKSYNLDFVNLPNITTKTRPQIFANHDGVLSYNYFYFLDKWNYQYKFDLFKNNFKMFYKDETGDYFIEFVFKNTGFFKSDNDITGFNGGHIYSEENNIGFISHPKNREIFSFKNSLQHVFYYSLEYIYELENFTSLSNYKFKPKDEFYFERFLRPYHNGLDVFNISNELEQKIIDIYNLNNDSIKLFRFFKKDSFFAKKVMKKLKVAGVEFNYLIAVRLV